MDEQRIASIEVRLEDGDMAMQQLKTDLADNTATTKRIDTSTKEIVEFFNAMQGAFKVLNWIGKLAKPIGAIIALCVALWTAWTAFKSGSPTK